MQTQIECILDDILVKLAIVLDDPSIVMMKDFDEIYDCLSFTLLHANPDWSQEDIDKMPCLGGQFNRILSKIIRTQQVTGD